MANSRYPNNQHNFPYSQDSLTITPANQFSVNLFIHPFLPCRQLLILFDVDNLNRYESSLSCPNCYRLGCDTLLPYPRQQ